MRITFASAIIIITFQIVGIIQIPSFVDWFSLFMYKYIHKLILKWQTMFKTKIIKYLYTTKTLKEVKTTDPKNIKIPTHLIVESFF